MRIMPLAGTTLFVSRFAFGTASLHHVGPKKVQVDHLLAAYDAGFTHFDTAPLYGFGSSERILGAAFGGGNFREVTIASKVGLYPPGGTEQSRLAMLARKVVGKGIPKISRALVDFQVESARASLDATLLRLKRDHVDLLFLHEPDYQLAATDEWLRWLEDEALERVVSFGVAGPALKVKPFIAVGSPLARVVQIQDSYEKREADILANYGRVMQLTYGYLSSASKERSPEDILVRALARNKTGSVLVSTRNRNRLTRFSAISDAADHKIIGET